MPATAPPRAGASRPPRNEGASRRSATRAARSGLSFSLAPSSESRAISSPATRSSGKRSLPGVDLLQERLQRLGDRERSAGSGRAGPRPRRRLHPAGRVGRQQRAAARAARPRRAARRDGAGLRSDTVLVVQGEGDVAVGGDAGEAPALRAEPHLDGDRPRAATEPEQGAEVVLREVAAPGADLADLLRPPASSTVTRAPMAKGLGPFCLTSTPSQWWPLRCVFSSSVGSSSIALTTRSGSPSLSRSPTATARLHFCTASPRPAVADTSRKRPPSFRKIWSFCA